MSVTSISDYLQDLIPDAARKSRFATPYSLLLIVALGIGIIPFFIWTQSVGLIEFKISVVFIDRVYLWGLASILVLLWATYFFLEDILRNLI